MLQPYVKLSRKSLYAIFRNSTPDIGSENFGSLISNGPT